jgi:hypothetical protein
MATVLFKYVAATASDWKFKYAAKTAGPRYFRRKAPEVNDCFWADGQGQEAGFI